MTRRRFRLVPHVRFGPSPRLRPPVTFTGRVTRRRLLTDCDAATMPSADSSLRPARRIAATGYGFTGGLNPPQRRGEASPGKSALFRCTTPWFTSGTEPRASLCCASSPVPSALYHRFLSVGSHL
jgi:hypothetical protein